MKYTVLYRLPFREYLGTTVPGFSYCNESRDVTLVFAWESDTQREPWRVAIRACGIVAERRTEIEFVQSELLLLESFALLRIDDSEWCQSIQSRLDAGSKHSAVASLSHLLYWDEDIGVVEFLAKSWQLIGPEPGVVSEKLRACDDVYPWSICRH
jgi:hypothetical protein